ncbi:uncharacterized protein LACBIDRAFT_315112 [Laccaria bicolor S238N-H82]|uniref:Predicted protein n=1 Tax=Laccaria bicolor (strain S238N-H82 / ATCC MYA-4686) TaxID=486041 RepID=B0DZU7_LACBS|nr:uncharacterized protein LACBIDRAFT_315112 [Laccaria bicolor S238N-H82]EDQ99897.1 predicted protein [Laccaria bicolor S238N-H82]|eukprot:XP_001889440.1 predicted protein [Laccaria bicolor S238N-H82]
MPPQMSSTSSSAVLRKRPIDLDLSNTNIKNVGARTPLPALATARNIDDIRTVQYPEGVMSPKPKLNANVKDGRFRYDRGFLLQFMGVCTQKADVPSLLEPIIGLESVYQAPLGRLVVVQGAIAKVRALLRRHRKRQ